MTPRQPIAARVRAVLVLRGESTTDLAHALGCSSTHVFRLLKGEQELTSQHREALADHFGKAWGFILGTSDTLDARQVQR